jgi:acyl carrier protein
MTPVMEDVLTLIRLQLGVRGVSEDDRLMEDLGAESADVVNIIAAAEDKFQISFDEMDIASIRTVREVYDFISDKHKETENI